MKYGNIKLELFKNLLLIKHSILIRIISDLRKYAGYEIIMAAEIVECSEGDADLVLCCAVPVNVLLIHADC